MCELRKCLREVYGNEDFEIKMFFQKKTRDGAGGEYWDDFERHPLDSEFTDSEEEVVETEPEEEDGTSQGCNTRWVPETFAKFAPTNVP